MARGRREDRTMADKTFRWFAGVDWGSAKHLYPGERDQCLCKLIVRAGLSGATNYAPVPGTPVSGETRSVPVEADRARRPVGSDQLRTRARSTTVRAVPRQVGHDGCPVGSRALSANTGSGTCRDGSWKTRGQDHG